MASGCVLVTARDADRTLTCGDVAQMCGVTPRTVAMWMDRGFLKGRRLVGSADRRFDYKEVIDFMTFYRMDVLLTYPKHRFLKRRYRVFG